MNESWNLKLQLVREILMVLRAQGGGVPGRVRWANKLAADSTSLSRRGNVMLQYRF